MNASLTHHIMANTYTIRLENRRMRRLGESVRVGYR